jgi:hypothetical protein
MIREAGLAPRAAACPSDPWLTTFFGCRMQHQGSRLSQTIQVKAKVSVEVASFVHGQCLSRSVRTILHSALVASASFLQRAPAPRSLIRSCLGRNSIGGGRYVRTYLALTMLHDSIDNLAQRRLRLKTGQLF